MPSFRIRLLTTTAIAVLLVLPGVAEAAQPRAFKAVERGLERLVATPGGPPGAIATIHRGGRTTVLSAGRSNVRRRGAPRARDHMRIASVSKAFSGAVALNLVGKGRLGLDDTIGQRLPSLPVAWHPVTLRQMLNHTSGLPDYSASQGFGDQLRTNPGGYVSPSTIVEWVSANGLVFPPGSRYTYSNTENIIVALMAEAATGDSYGRLLRSVVFRPAGLTETSLPTRRIALPRPFLRGYLTEPGEEPEDVTTFISPSGAWASGGNRLHPARRRRIHAGLPAGEVLRGWAEARPEALRPRNVGPTGTAVRTPRGSRCSGTAPAAGRSTATPATSPGTPSGAPRPPTGGARSRPASTCLRPRARCSTASAECRPPPSAPCCGSSRKRAGPPQRPRPWLRLTCGRAPWTSRSPWSAGSGGR